MQEAIRIHQSDNVAVALLPLGKGQKVFTGFDTIELIEDIPVGHKFSLMDLSTGSDVMKYGYPIGKAAKQIRKGEWVHTHNVKTRLDEKSEYQYQPLDNKTLLANKMSLDNKTPLDNKISLDYNMPFVAVETIEKAINSNLADTSVVGGGEKDYFYGYRRKDQKAGIRNEIWIIPTVGCVNDVARVLEKKGKELIKSQEIDDVIAFTHPYGCSQLGADHVGTQTILAGLVKHPNAAGVLIVGLGCENNNIDEFKKEIGDYSEERVKFLVCQDWEDELEQGLKLLHELVEFGAGFQKEKIPINELIIGLKCGGSDGLSGITANPLVGKFSDMLTEKGGTTILTEVPEMFGAETILMNRCENVSLFEQTVSMINDFKQYYIEHGQPVYENPSPGNKKGGITTLEDKSLGCTQKSGTSKVRGVLQYGERVSEKGLLLLSSPGNDLVATTALAAAGAHIILFTTGRGTPFGASVPTIKISSNSTLSSKKKNWTDFDAGRLLQDQTIDILSEELFEFVLSVASGARVKNEINGYRDIAIFKQGVTL